MSKFDKLMPGENLILEQTDSVDETALSWRYTLGKTCTALKSDHRSWECSDCCPSRQASSVWREQPLRCQKGACDLPALHDAHRTQEAGEMRWFTSAAHRTQVAGEILWFTSASNRTQVTGEILWFTSAAHRTQEAGEILWWVSEDLQWVFPASRLPGKDCKILLFLEKCSTRPPWISCDANVELSSVKNKSNHLTRKTNIVLGACLLKLTRVSESNTFWKSSIFRMPLGAQVWNYSDTSILKVFLTDMMHKQSLIMRKFRQTQFEGHFSKYLTNTSQEF